MKKILSVFLSVVMALTCCLAFGTTAFADDYENVAIYINPGQDAATVIQEAIREKLNPATLETNCRFTVQPAGTYQLSSRLVVYSNTVLDLTGVTLVKGYADSTMVAIGKYNEVATGSSFYHNISFVGGTFDGAGLKGSLVTFSHASNVSFTGVSFKNCCSGHHLTFAGCSNVVVDGCSFSGHTYAGNDKDENMEAIQLDILEPNHFPGLEPQGYDGTMNSNVVVQNCNFNQVNRGVGSHSIFAGKYMTNISILNNSFNNVGGYAIQTSNYLNTAIIGNVITNCGSGIYYRSMNPNQANTFAGASAPVIDPSVVIQNNSIQVVKTSDSTFKQLSYGIRVFGENLASNAGAVKAGDYRAYNVNISNNSIDLRTNANGVWLVGAVGATVGYNSISYNSVSTKTSEKCFGIRYEVSPKTNLVGNVIAANGFACVQNGIISDKSKGAVITGNTVSKAKKNGINISTKSQATLNSNTVTANGENGIFCYSGSSINTNGNVVSKNKKHGIFIVNCTDVSNLKKDKVTANKQYGIGVQNSVAKVTNVTASKNNKEGIFSTQKSKTTIIGGTVQGNKGNGVYYTHKSKGAVKKTAISKNKGYGIYRTNDSGVVKVSAVKYTANKGGKIR